MIIYIKNLIFSSNLNIPLYNFCFRKLDGFRSKDAPTSGSQSRNIWPLGHMHSVFLPPRFWNLWCNCSFSLLHPFFVNVFCLPGSLALCCNTPLLLMSLQFTTSLNLPGLHNLFCNLPSLLFVTSSSVNELKQFTFLLYPLYILLECFSINSTILQFLYRMHFPDEKHHPFMTGFSLE